MLRGLRMITAIVGIFVVPFLLVEIGVIPVELRRWVYVAVGIVALAVAVKRYSMREMGVQWANVRVAVLAYGLFAVVGAAGIVGVALATGRVLRPEWWLAPHFRYGVLIPVSVAQEFFYRSMLMPMLREVLRSPRMVIVVNAALFTLLHVVFPDPAIVLPLSFLGGIVFATLWTRWPNIWLASATHVVLNAAFTLFCFGGFETSCIV
ncbi:MAG: CPBP family intramembrane metalloprotease [bacterium]|nr:CPBP family intramembrane metalloprotease [bacterium]